MRKLICCGLLMAALPLANAATVESASRSVKEAITRQLAAHLPEIKIVSINSTPWSGVFEVVAPDGIFYSDASGEHIINGQIIATTSRENLTDARWNALNHIDFNSLPFASAIKVVKGDGSRKIAVFADPDCPFCQKLEQEMLNLDNTTVYTFLYPLDIHPNAAQHARQIWCAKDKSTAWTDWMLKRVAPTGEACSDEPMETLRALATRLKVDSTPTLFFPDGHRVDGLIDGERLEKELSKAVLN